MISDEVGEILAQAQSLDPKGATLTLDANVKKAKKTFLSFEELKKLLAEGGALPEDKMLPSLSMQQYQELPGGLSAYQNIIPMMDAIKGTAGTDGDAFTPPSDDDDDDSIVEVNCPTGFKFNAVLQQCMPIEEEKPDTGDSLEKDAVDSSYQSYVESIVSNPDYTGNWDSFKKIQNDSFLKKTMGFFFDENKLYKTWGTAFNKAGSGYSAFDDKYDDQGIGLDSPMMGAGVYDPDKVGQGPVYSGQPLTPFQPPQQIAPEDDGGVSDSFTPPSAPIAPEDDGGVSDPFTPPQQIAPEDDGEPSDTGGGFSSNISGNVSGRKKEGGFVEQTKPIQLDDVSLKMQEGGQVPVTPPVEGMPMPSGQPAGFIQDPSAAPAPDTPMDALQGEGQKDDVMGELPEGTFVINAMAVQLAGIEELDTMVEKAYEDLSENMRKKGIDENLVTQLVGSSRSRAGMKEQMVDVAVSNGEYIIPPEIVPIIGEDKLRKINDRGLRKLEKEKKVKEKQPEAPMMMDKGGFVIATDSDGKILTEKVKDESGREVSRILSRDEVKAPEDKGQPSDTFDSPVKDISKSKSFVRKETPDEIVDKRNRSLMAKRLSTPEVDTPMSMNKDALMAKRLSTPEVDTPMSMNKDALMAKRLSTPEVDTPIPVEKQDSEELRDAATYAETGPVYSGQPLTGFVKQTPRSKETDEQKISRITAPQGPINSGILNSVRPERFSDIEDTMNLINDNVTKGDADALQAILDSDKNPNTDFKGHPSAMDRIKDILLKISKFDIEYGLRGKPTVKIPDHVKKEIRIENSKIKENLIESIYPELFRDEPKNTKSNFMESTSTPSSQDFNTKSNEDKQNIIRNFLKNKLNISAPANNKFGVKALPVSMMQEPRNADNIFTREGDFPEKIDPNDNVALNQLFLRVLEKETIGLDDKAVSPKGAIGLSQLMPDTIKDPGSGLVALLPESERQFLDPRIVGDTPLTDNNANLLFGTFYLKSLLLYYKGDVAKALGAYNDGFGDTNELIKEYGEKWVDNAPRETRDYILTIKGYLRPAPDIPLPKARPKQSRVGGFV